LSDLKGVINVEQALSQFENTIQDFDLLPDDQKQLKLNQINNYSQYIQKFAPKLWEDKKKEFKFFYAKLEETNVVNNRNISRSGESIMPDISIAEIATEE